MAATVHLDESNGYPETVTESVTSLAMGTVDASGMTPGAPGARQTASSNSMQKAIRLHLTALGGSLGISQLRVYCEPTASGWTLWTNASDDPSEYEVAKVTVYEEPTNGTGPVPYAMPVADPLAPNLGIAGDLDGELLATGRSDYCYIQLRADGTVTVGFSSPLYIAYDELG